MLDQALKEYLERLQFSDHKRVVLIDQLPVGYGGQLSRRLLGLKIGLVLDRKAIFLSDADFPYTQSIERLFAWPHDLRLAAEWPLVDLPDQDSRPLVRFDYFLITERLRRLGLTVEGWVKAQLAEGLKLTPDDLEKIDGWLVGSLRFVPAFEQRLDADVSRLGVSKRVLGAHVRRGDKKVETAYVSMNRINDAIDSIYSVWKFEGLFVATDDAGVLPDLKVPPGVQLLFDHDEIRYNNANHKMLMASPEMASEETYVAFKNFRLLCECGGIVGQDNAHFATIAASHVFYRDAHAERIHLLDPSQGSKVMTLISRMKWHFRTLVKAILPRSVLDRLNHIIHRRR